MEEEMITARSQTLIICPCNTLIELLKLIIKVFPFPRKPSIERYLTAATYVPYAQTI